jgi:hypothetical protein
MSTEYPIIKTKNCTLSLCENGIEDFDLDLCVFANDGGKQCGDPIVDITISSNVCTGEIVDMVANMLRTVTYWSDYTDDALLQRVAERLKAQ